MLTGWKDFDDTLRTFDRLQRRFDRPLSPFDLLVAPPRLRVRSRAPWPATNVFETKTAFVVRADVPGLTEADVSVTVEEETLVIRGERKVQVPEGYQVHLREREGVAFTRKVPLPARVDADAVTASLNEGVLTVTLPKAREAMPRQIAVKAG
jgi:HSP20 family protein